jgi:hypothetical protein
MKTESARRAPPEKATTPTEIATAIDSLTTADLLRLRQYAWRRIRRLGPKAGGKEGDDLLHSALEDLLQDTRRWDKTKVGFMGFLFGAMKSISSNWAKSYVSEEIPVLEADLRKKDDEGKEFSRLDGYRTGQPNAEQELSDTQTLQQIDTLFNDDQEAQMLLTAWQEGYDPAGVRELWSLSQNEYNTIVRRIRRTLDAADIRPDRDRGGIYVQ